MIVSANNNFYNKTRHNSLVPSFGSVVLSRVVLRGFDKSGEPQYLILKNSEKGIVGVYQSLSRKVKNGKSKDIIEKLRKAIPDFNINRPIIHSTLIGVRSSYKRFLLTGSDAMAVRDCGSDLIGALNNRSAYREFVRKLLYNFNSRVFNKQGNEIGIDLIVEGSYGNRKLVDVDVVDAEALNKAKISMKKSVLSEENVQQIQKEFDFVKTLTPPRDSITDYLH